ncbi:MAG: hypothetical protein J6M10_03660 [Clostridia bacterium]|nr:hypothetical protein [Clostridia bacterium]
MMPNSINIPTPPALSGTPDMRLEQLCSYLFRLSEQIAMVLRDMEAGASASGVTATQGGAGDMSLQREQIKQLIVNTAAQLRSEMHAAAPRSGTVTSGALAGGAYEDIDISFGEELPVVPVVTLSLAAPAAFTAGGACCYTIAGSVTTTGFKVRIANASSDTTAHSFTAMWIAAV